MKLIRRGPGPLFVIASFIILLILLPSLSLTSYLLKPVSEGWRHIQTYLLKDYIINSLTLIGGVGFLTVTFGVYFSWSLSRYDYGLPKLFTALLLLPMAIPPYIAGYIYGGIFNNFGTFERIMTSLNLQPIKIDMLSMGGAIFIFTLFLMPYVVLVTKSFFDKLPPSIEESSRLLGKNAYQIFFKIILPMSRGALMGGLVLVVLEVLNDYGLVKYFGIPTFSTAIYATWFGLGDIESAIRLAASLMVIVITILIIEQFLRGKGRLSPSRAPSGQYQKKKPSLLARVIFYSTIGLYATFSLLIPILQLIQWSLLSRQSVVFRKLDLVLTNTMSLAIMVTILVMISGLIIGNLNRLHQSVISKIYSRLVILGYSIPASIIAVAVLTLFIGLDQRLANVYEVFHLKTLFLAGGLGMLIFALVLRFMAIGFNSIESGYSKMGKSYYEASKLLGKGEWKTFLKVDLPILKPAIIGGIILTFVDVLKELPLTLILRPFNYETLATRVFTYAGDEMIHEASIYALMIIGVSVVALTLLHFVHKEVRK